MNVFSVYLLRCEDNKRYSGSTLTDQVQERFEAHRAGQGAKWTMKYRPLEILKTWDNLSSHEAFMFEHKLCEEQMLLHKDLDACRGGRYNFPDTGPASHWWCPKRLRHLLKR